LHLSVIVPENEGWKMTNMLTNKWTEDIRTNLPKCPACGGPVEYGFFVSKDAIHWASGVEGNKFTDLEEPMTGPFKKPLGVGMARCHKCRLYVSVFPPR